MEPAACSSCSAKLRCAGVGLKSYLSSGKSSAMAMSLRPTSFQESSTTFASGSAGLTAASFLIASFFIESFMASWACAGNAHASRTIARNGIVFISFSTIEFRKQSFRFLFRLRQLRNNCGNFIECLDPALELTAIFRALHGFISNEGEFRLAVPEILKEGHVVRTLDGLMFYSQLRSINLVSLRVRKVHQGNDLLVRNNLVVFNPIPELLPIRRLRAAEKFSPNAKIHLANGRSEAFRPPPLLHILRVCPRLPNYFAWGIKNSCDHHALGLVHGAFCHLWPPLSSFDLQVHPVCRSSLPRIGDS